MLKRKVDILQSQGLLAGKLALTSRQTSALTSRQPSAKSTGKSLKDRWASPNMSADTGTAAAGGIHLVSDVRRNPRNTVSSSRGASSPGGEGGK